jgi:hypothetical protein
MASKIRTKVYAPNQNKVTHTIPGRIDDDAAVMLTKQYLEEQIQAMQAVLDSGDNGDWVVVVTATAPSAEVSNSGNGAVTFPSDETSPEDV